MCYSWGGDNMMPLPLFHRILAAVALFFAVGACSSCTKYSARFIDMGQVHSGIEITQPEEVYLVGNRRYIRGESAKFKYRGNRFWIYLKGSDGEYIRIPGSENGSRYHEIAIDPDFAPDVYYLTSGGEWLTSLPGKSTGLIISHDKNSRQQLCDRETECTLHALYSYPLAAATFVAVDVPAALVSTAWGVLTIPYYLAKAALD